MTKETCLQCKDLMCVDHLNGRVITELKTMRPTEIPNQPVNRCPKRKVEDASPAPKVDDLDFDEINRWFSLEGKTDTLHLGS